MKELIDKSAVVAAVKTIYNEDYKFLPSDLVESVQDFKDDLLTALDGLSTVKNANDAYKQGYNDAIDKVCKWLKFNYAEFTDNTRLGIKIDELINDFKKDMEEQL